MFTLSYSGLIFLLLKVTFAVLRTTSISNTTAAATTTTPATACDEDCYLVLEAGVLRWETYETVVATQIVFIENGTNNTSTSIKHEPSINFNGASINDPAVSTITDGLYDTLPPFRITASRTFLLTFPTPVLYYGDRYALEGEIYTTFYSWEYTSFVANSSDVTGCHSYDGTSSTSLSIHPSYTPIPADFDSINQIAFDPVIPQGLSSLLASYHPIFKQCTAVLDGQPMLLMATTFLTDTSTVYNGHTSPAPISSVQIPIQTSFPGIVTTSPESVKASTKSVDFPISTPRQTSAKASSLTDSVTLTLQPPKSSTAIHADPVSGDTAALPKVSTIFTNPALSSVETHAASPQQPVSSAPASMPQVRISYSSLPNSAILIGAQTLEPGGPPITVSDKVISLGPEGTPLAVGDSSGGSTVLLPVNVPSGLISTPMPTPTTLVIGSQTITVQPGASEIQISGQTITAGGSGITVSGGTYISLAPSGSALIVGGSSVTLGNVPSSVSGGSSETVITLAGKPVTLGPDSPIVLDGTTLSAGSAVTISGIPVSLSPSGSILVVEGSSINLSPATVTIPPAPSVPAKVITIAGKPVTLTHDSPIVLDGTALAAGSAVTISGTPISLSPSNSVLVVGGTSITLFPATTTPPTPNVPAQVLTIAGTPVTLTPGSPIVLDGSTLTPSGPALTISGTPISLGPSSKYLIIGTSSISLPVETEVLTIGTRIVTANSASEFILNGQTLIPGGSEITVDETTVSLAVGATEVVVGGTTERVGGGLGGLIWSGIGGSVSVPVQTGVRTGNGTGGAFTGDAGMIHQRIERWKILFVAITTLTILK